MKLKTYNILNCPFTRPPKKLTAARQKKLEADKLKALQRSENAAMMSEREKNRRRRNEPLFKNRAVDYSQLISVRIDHKTIIYAKPGQDIEALKRKFEENKTRPTSENIKGIYKQ